MLAAAEDESAQRADISIIAAPGDSHVAVRWYNVIGRIHVQPAQPAAVGRYPCMGSIGTYQAGLTRGRIGPEIAADIARSEMNGTKTGYLDVGEILTDTAPW